MHGHQKRVSRRHKSVILMRVQMLGVKCKSSTCQGSNGGRVLVVIHSGGSSSSFHDVVVVDQRESQESRRFSKIVVQRDVHQVGEAQSLPKVLCSFVGMPCCLQVVHLIEAVHSALNNWLQNEWRDAIPAD